jgi:hypothetical protein
MASSLQEVPNLRFLRKLSGEENLLYADGQSSYDLTEASMNAGGYVVEGFDFDVKRYHTHIF